MVLGLGQKTPPPPPPLFPIISNPLHLLIAPKKYFLKNINMGIKNAIFYADFKFVDADLNKCP
jgi:hypothetical protein